MKAAKFFVDDDGMVNVRKIYGAGTGPGWLTTRGPPIREQKNIPEPSILSYDFTYLYWRAVARASRGSLGMVTTDPYILRLTIMYSIHYAN